MKILVTGALGQLGYDVLRAAKMRGIHAQGVDIAEMDITDEACVKRVIGESDADTVIHCAAWTAVDAAEDSPESCRRVNALGTEYIARAASLTGKKLIYLSTDYVFDGEGARPWRVDDQPCPRNVYGATKYEGEQAVRACAPKHFIVRISWVFGKNGKNFVRTMLRLGRENGAVRVVNDQFGSPTYTADLAGLLLNMAETEAYGTYHATNEGECTWYEFACEIFKQARLDVAVMPVSSADFPAKAKRPRESRMDKSSLDANGFARLPDWRDALRRYLTEIDEQPSCSPTI